ncbi:RNA-binding S4 domain-containing protein [uncultured Mucilaginibacter sp.]|uniref:RNA-binding S4 domain-containing protein n=1 Tax=uncultured Mucilaginibacter sp. TaxID=797541 RepID=UPI0025F6D642|nr:RNA-binding S4 domain-containing protein [uncultured Mucilaginibacter sp.]
MPEKEKLRIDKYLWAIRIFKTRTLASEACKAGRVKINGQNIKASHEVKVGETYNISKGLERKIITVTGLLENRVDAKKAVEFYSDLTPVENTPSFKSMFNMPMLRRDRGTGRPTKRDRREIDDLQDGYFAPQPPQTGSGNDDTEE